MLSAILYVDVVEGNPTTVEHLEHLSLGNCLQMVHRFSTGEVIIQLTCNDPGSLNTALTDFASVEGVTRITPCVIRQV